MLAGVSTDYYIRLEQGRERHPSAQVLDALARVLELDAEATEYLHELVRPRVGRRVPTGPVERVNPEVLRLIEAWDRTPTLVVSFRLDILAASRLATVVMEGMEHNENLIRLTFLNPAAPEFFLDWEQEARANVAHLRAAAGANHNDPFLLELVDELSLGSEEFRRLWARHDVRAKPHEYKRVRHHEVGELILWRERFAIESTPGQYLFVYQAEPGSPSEKALDRLRSRLTDEE